MNLWVPKGGGAPGGSSNDHLTSSTSSALMRSVFVRLETVRQRCKQRDPLHPTDSLLFFPFTFFQIKQSVWRYQTVFNLQAKGSQVSRPKHNIEYIQNMCILLHFSLKYSSNLETLSSKSDVNYFSIISTHALNVVCLESTFTEAQLLLWNRNGKTADSKTPCHVSSVTTSQPRFRTAAEPTALIPIITTTSFMRMRPSRNMV